MDRLVIVPASAVADLVDLIGRACEEVDTVLADALWSAAANLVSVAVLEPVDEPALV